MGYIWSFWSKCVSGQGILERLEAGEVILGDGSYGNTLEKRGYVKVQLFSKQKFSEQQIFHCLFVCLPGGQLHAGEQCRTPWGRWTIGARVRKLKNQTLNNYLVIWWETVIKHIIAVDVHYRWCCCMITLLKHIQKSNSNKYPVVEGNHILQPLFDLYVVVWEHISFQPGMQEQEQTLLRHSPTTREMWGCLKAATSLANRSTRWVFSLKAAFT